MREWLIDIFTLSYEGVAFVDKVSGKCVHYFIDRNGKKWMKEGRFSTFKVEAV